jgi:Xaa-Pro aminopeptidase
MDPFLDRRRRFMAGLGDGIAVVPAATETVRNHDVTHPFRQDSDFFYLTGFTEPDSVALLDPQHDHEQYVLFVRPRDPDQEAWTGRRAGVEGAIERYGADAAYPLSELENQLRSRVRGRSALYYSTNGSKRDTTIQRILATAAAYGARTGLVTPSRVIDPSPLLGDLRLVKSAAEADALREACRISAEGHAEAMRFTVPGMVEREVQAAMEFVFRSLGSERDGYPAIVASGPNAVILHYVDNDRRMADSELLLIDAGAEYGYQSADITRTFPVGGTYTAPQRDIYNLVLAAQQDVFAACRPGTPFAALHDTAARTVSNGLVELGLLPGPVDDAVRYGWYREFFFHGTGHWLGMDVHDAGAYGIDGAPRPIEVGMAFTVEPGVYIAPDKAMMTLYALEYDESAAREAAYLKGAAVAKKELAERRASASSVEHEVPAVYRGMGVRIEDDVLVASDGYEVLSAAVPSDPDAVEAMCAEPSRLPRLGS